MLRRRHWYSRFGVEEPFPWVGLLIAACVAAPIVGLVFAVIVGLSWSALS